jgi:hypothetical protein
VGPRRVFSGLQWVWTGSWRSSRGCEGVPLSYQPCGALRPHTQTGGPCRPRRASARFTFSMLHLCLEEENISS